MDRVSVVFSMVMDPQHVPALDGSLDGSRWQQLYRQTLDHWMVEMQCPEYRLSSTVALVMIVLLEIPMANIYL
ncbi:hypothetical protein DERF_009900 [Dermatophagoides farinae]|uniref:Uncharacterized protein n=1 Tax=Dermatophagoides farinae TaxID=6954 RepID=A0A922HXU6_DERFA|nr:hypothetical protein DERF_009900 [Dermatophagoides farinae]